MISPKEFTNYLASLGINLATGVPDSTFKGFISYIGYKESPFRHVIASNECEALAIACGNYLASNKPAVVYMQNSGFGKIINPYTSLASKDVYSIPSLIMVGWRGEPGKPDEPQHKMMGRIFIDLLKSLELTYSIIDSDNWKDELNKAQKHMENNLEPYVIIVKKGIFDKFSPSHDYSGYSLSREEALKLIVQKSTPKSSFVSTTGKTSRELFEIRENTGQSHQTDFYTVGSMGCASSIALGIALNQVNDVYVIDGDGASLMQLGTLTAIGHLGLNNIKHILIDNNANDSTGGQPTLSNTVNFDQIAKASGYKTCLVAHNKDELIQHLEMLNHQKSLSLLVIKCKKGARKNLGRPTTTPIENKNSFMEYLKNE